MDMGSDGHYDPNTGMDISSTGEIVVETPTSMDAVTESEMRPTRFPQSRSYMARARWQRMNSGLSPVNKRARGSSVFVRTLTTIG